MWMKILLTNQSNETNFECFRENANTRLLLHDLRAAESVIENVVINTNDSDVLVGVTWHITSSPISSLL